VQRRLRRIHHLTRRAILPTAFRRTVRLRTDRTRRGWLPKMWPSATGGTAVTSLRRVSSQTASSQTAQQRTVIPEILGGLHGRERLASDCVARRLDGGPGCLRHVVLGVVNGGGPMLSNVIDERKALIAIYKWPTFGGRRGRGRGRGLLAPARDPARVLFRARVRPPDLV